MKLGLGIGVQYISKILSSVVSVIWKWGDNAGAEKWGDNAGAEKWGDNL